MSFSLSARLGQTVISLVLVCFAAVGSTQVQASVGGNLNIESLQGSSDYHSQQSNKGISLSIPIAGTGSASGSISAGKSSINSDYQSVAEQSSIRAGDGGFQVSVGGDTKLVGGQITSTQKAIDDNRNSFNTGGTLTTTDINNTADYKAKAVGVQLGTSVNHTGQYQPSGTSAGVGKDSGSASSTTTAGISGVTESGNPQVRTGDAQTGLANTFDAGKVQADINAQVQITQVFGQQASKAVAEYAASKIKDIKAEQKAEAAKPQPDLEKLQALKEEQQKWDEGGLYRVALHTAVGGLAGGASGATGAGAAAAAAPTLNDLQDSLAKGLEDAGAHANVSQAAAQLITGITAAGIGGAASGGSAIGAVTAFNSDSNNRQLHPTEVQWIKQNAKRYAKQLGISEAVAEKLLAEQAFRQVQFGAEGGAAAWDAQAAAFLKQAGSYLLPGDPNIPGQNVGYMFYATPAQRANASMYLASTQEYADFYKQNGLKQPTAQELTNAAQHNAELRANLSTATKTAMAASATIALGGLSPAMLQWALSNPIAATQAGVISAETAAAIVSGAVSPSGLLQQVSNPQAARVVYNRLATAATQNPLSDEVVLGRYLINDINSYEKIAQARGATYYEVAAWEGISKELGNREKLWEINKSFLDKAMLEGKSFLLTGDPDVIVMHAPKLFSAMEVNYLKSNGYKFRVEGDFYRAFK